MEQEKRDQLIELIKKQKEIYQKMLEIVTRQNEILNSEDPSLLLPLAEQVTQLKQVSGLLQQDIDPLKEEWSAGRDTIPDDQREVLKTLTMDVKQILSSVLEKMNQLRENADQSKSEVLARLRKMSQGQAAQKGYGNFGKNYRKNPRFMDRNE